MSHPTILPGELVLISNDKAKIMTLPPKNLHTTATVQPILESEIIMKYVQTHPGCDLNNLCTHVMRSSVHKVPRAVITTLIAKMIADSHLSMTEEGKLFLVTI
jgi:hypothetical protein